jgi:hypothetical protein
MTIRELAKLAQNCREAQKRYYDHRSQTNLILAKTEEKRLDRAIDEVMNPPPPRLFDEKL